MASKPDSTRRQQDREPGVSPRLTSERAAEMELVDVTVRRLRNEDVELVLAPATMAGLETVVLGVVTPGGVVPLFAHLSSDILEVLSISLMDGEMSVGNFH